jgi:hypothetical protein
MSKNTGSAQDRLTSLFACLLQLERLWIATTDPFFAGVCPEQRYWFGQRVRIPSLWDYSQYEWSDRAWGVASEL